MRSVLASLDIDFTGTGVGIDLYTDMAFMERKLARLIWETERIVNVLQALEEPF